VWVSGGGLVRLRVLRVLSDPPDASSALALRLGVDTELYVVPRPRPPDPTGPAAGTSNGRGPPEVLRVQGVLGSGRTASRERRRRSGGLSTKAGGGPEAASGAGGGGAGGSVDDASEQSVAWVSHWELQRLRRSCGLGGDGRGDRGAQRRPLFAAVRVLEWDSGGGCYSGAGCVCVAVVCGSAAVAAGHSVLSGGCLRAARIAAHRHQASKQASQLLRTRRPLVLGSRVVRESCPRIVPLAAPC